MEIENRTARGQGVHIDLSKTSEISRSAGLLLTAQIERSRERINDCVNGYSPFDLDLAKQLSSLGFYRHLGFTLPTALQGFELDEDLVTVCSGVGVTANLSEQLERVAASGRGMFEDDGSFVDRIHGSLNEAMTNIFGHAYMREATEMTSFERKMHASSRLFVPPVRDLSMTVPTADPKWWFAGQADTDHSELVLNALDFGATIPAVAPLRMAETLNAYWAANPPRRAKRKGRVDYEVLEGVARASRAGYGNARRQQGFPNMIGLVEEAAIRGSVTVVSGAGVYHFQKFGGNRPNREHSYPLRNLFQGTLIEWRIAGPDKRDGDERG